MEVEGPLYDEATDAGYRLLFGELPLQRVEAGSPGVAVPFVDHTDRREGGRNAGQRVQALGEAVVDVVSTDPKKDADRLMRGFLRAPTAGPPPRATCSVSSRSSRTAAPPA